MSSRVPPHSDAEWPRDLDADQLVEWIAARLEHLEAETVLRALRHPFTSSELVAMIGAHPRLLAIYAISREVARHPRAPLVLAMRAVTTLFWRDHLEVAIDVRVAPQVRRLAEQRLVERLPSLAVGEKVSLARRASPALQMQLRRDPDLRVIRALLENPRLTESVLVPLLASPETRPDVLAAIAADPRWGVRMEVRRALARNPRTPVEVALGLIATLPRSDQRAVAQDSRLNEAVRRRARLVSGLG